MIGAATSEAQSPVQQVLMLQSLQRGNMTLDHFAGEFRVSLDQHAGKPVNVVQVVVGPTGSVGASERAVVDYIRSTYANRAACSRLRTCISAAPRSNVGIEPLGPTMEWEIRELTGGTA